MFIEKAELLELEIFIDFLNKILIIVNTVLLTS